MGKRTVAECNDLFKSFAHSDHEQRSTIRISIPASSTPSASRGLHQVSLETTVAAALKNFQREVSKEIQELKAKVDKCEVCRGSWYN